MLKKLFALSIKQKVALWAVQFIVVVAWLLLTQVFNTPATATSNKSNTTQALRLNADLTSLFNQKSSQTPLNIQTITQKISASTNNTHVVLVGSSHKETAINGAMKLTSQLSKLPLIGYAQTRFNDIPTLDGIIAQYLPFKQQVISHKMHKLLSDETLLNESSSGTPSSQKVFNYQFALLNQIGNQAVAKTVEQDPSLSLADFLSQPIKVNSSLKATVQHLIAQYNDKYYVLVTFASKNQAMNVDEAQQLQAQFQQIINQPDAEHNIKNQLTKNKAIEYLYTGALFYTASASESSQFEMLLYGSISLIATLLLIAFVYRRISALLMTFSLIAISFCYGYAALSMIYLEVNVITLVFSVTLIGIASDYSFHALTQLKYSSAEASFNRKSPLKNIHSSLAMSYITTGAGYAILLLTPFVLFQQIAVFTLAGLFGALITVLCLYPFFLPLFTRFSTSSSSSSSNSQNTTSSDISAKLPSFALKLNKAQQYLVTMIHQHKKIALLVIMASVLSTSVLKFDDDIKRYYQPEAKLKANEVMIKSILNNQWDSQYLLLQATSQQDLLEQEEILTLTLRNLVINGAIKDFSAISNWLPSLKQQQQNKQAIIAAQTADQFKPMQQILAAANWQFESTINPLTPSDWLSSPLGKMHQAQWLTDNEFFYSVVKLAGITDKQALLGLATNSSLVNSPQAKLYFIDQAGEITAQLTLFSKHLVLTLIAILFIALGVFSIKYGKKVACLAVLAPMFAVLISLLISFCIQGHLNIFNLVASILVIALGLDYSIFYTEHGFSPKVTLTTLMSALSSIFVFAILILSSMPVIASFGLSVFIGVGVTFLFAPIVTLAKSNS
jgi:predicted exporter